MRKITAAVIVSALVITLGGTTALAFGRSGQTGYQNNVAGSEDMVYNENSKCEYCEEYGRHYVDTDNDGICDNCTRNTDDTVSYCRRGYSSSDSSHYYESSGNGYQYAASASCDGTGQHAGHGYGHR